MGPVSGPQLIDLVEQGCRRLLLCASSAVQVEALRLELLEAADGEQLDPEVRGGLERLEVVGLPEFVLSTKEMRDAIWPHLREARW
jgi:hypothetical protein